MTTTATPHARRGAASDGAESTERLPRGIAVAAGVVFLLPGLWAFLAPASFYEMAATFEPYNAHFIRDIGAFQIGLGLVLVLAAFVRDALLVALLGVGTGAGFHLASHVIDRGHGGDPAVDLPVFGVVAVALLVAAAARATHLRRHGGSLPRREGTAAGS
jgi:uncharacterized protein YjeT (DUF2065 family)